MGDRAGSSPVIRTNKIERRRYRVKPEIQLCSLFFCRKRGELGSRHFSLSVLFCTYSAALKAQNREKKRNGKKEEDV